jgi:hypothetical protein
MDLTIHKTLIGGDTLNDDYCVIHDGRRVGRIRLAEERSWQGVCRSAIPAHYPAGRVCGPFIRKVEPDPPVTPVTPVAPAGFILRHEPFPPAADISLARIFCEPVMSIDQARMAFLALSLAQIATQHHKLSLEMATIRGMRRELAVKVQRKSKRQRFVIIDDVA